MMQTRWLITGMVVGSVLAWANDAPQVQSTGGRIAFAWHKDGHVMRAQLSAAPGRLIGSADACYGESNSIVIAWEESPVDGADTGIHAQKLSALGTPQWGPAGIVVNDFRGHQRAPRVAAVPGGAAIVWQSDSAGAQNNNIWCQCILNNGRARWETPAAVCAARGDQRAPAIAADQDMGVVIAWEDYRRGHADIYAQRIDADGAPLGPEDGVAIEDAPGDQRNPRFVHGSDGTLLLVWDDYRPGFSAPVQVQSDLTHLPVPEPGVAAVIVGMLLQHVRVRRAAYVR